MTAPYLPVHEDLDAKTRRPDEDHQRQVRRADRHGGEQRVPEDSGLRGRVEQWAPRKAAGSETINQG